MPWRPSENGPFDWSSHRRSIIGDQIWGWIKDIRIGFSLLPSAQHWRHGVSHESQGPEANATIFQWYSRSRRVAAALLNVIQTYTSVSSRFLMSIDKSMLLHTIEDNKQALLIVDIFETGCTWNCFLYHAIFHCRLATYYSCPITATTPSPCAMHWNSTESDYVLRPSALIVFSILPRRLP